MNKPLSKEKIIKVIKEILTEYRIKKAFIFGSFARGERFNDIDIIIEPPKGFSLLDLSSLVNRIEDRTGLKTDIITRKGISPHLRKYIEKEAVEI